MSTQADPLDQDTFEDLTSRVSHGMERLVADLAALVAHPSVSFEGYDPARVHAAARATAELVNGLGLGTAELLDIGGPFPVVWLERYVGPHMPTVLLYAHYDVQPAPRSEQGWESDPFELTAKPDGRLYGRGAADDKGGIVQHVGALRALHPWLRDNLNIKLCIEGDEEAGGPLAEYVASNPERFDADLFVIADVGNISVGEPVVVTQLRGGIKMTVRVSTLASPLHSGMFGGPAPDAFIAASKLVSSLFDEEGNVSVIGLAGGEWDGASYPSALFAEHAGLLRGVETIGSGTVADHLWARPSITVLATDLPTLERSAAILHPSVTLELGIRYAHPAQGDQVAAAVRAHLSEHAPWGAHVEVLHESIWPTFADTSAGAVAQIVRRSLTDAFGVPARDVGAGGSIPLLSALQGAAPQATFATFGPEDQGASRIHGGNESVDRAELERCVLAEALLLGRVAENVR